MYNLIKRGLLPVAGLLVAGILAGCGGSGSSGSAKTATAADRAFVAEMIPHHKLAVQMAQMAQRQGTHPNIKTLASSITATQNREISQMSAVAAQIGAKVDDQAASGQMHTGAMMSANAQTLGISMDKMGMSMDMSKLARARPFDREFIDMMTPHHQGAITMAKAELAKGTDPKLKTLAQSIISDQTREIGQMSSWRIKWYGAPVPPGAAAGAGAMQGMPGM